MDESTYRLEPESGTWKEHSAAASAVLSGIRECREGEERCVYVNPARGFSVWEFDAGSNIAEVEAEWDLEADEQDRLAVLRVGARDWASLPTGFSRVLSALAKLPLTAVRLRDGRRTTLSNLLGRP
ncbi:MAG: hypothetical protein QM765_13625 [Myxococcales bacterium]